ncbi:MAG: ABC transporter permease [Inconstantimicrobium porci]|uniref:ABC transporter permease n=1 Tax=Inconstantimicrobium porci TaxID=2652291 RepID=UPI002409A5C8|nr:ABC transporter permease [Inconstantimicrobium porci]MDD6770361.1 ABC transporter permease [Inconstantimicrobium porci]MDY5911218.1 ABC transporter permease [Inconstantimicrobium porci]
MKKRPSIAYPYLIWSIIFIVFPLFIVLYYSFTSKVNGATVFSLENYKTLFSVDYIKVFYRSLKLAFLSTILCLLLGYPIAYIISKMKTKKRNIYILLFILPMWMNFLLRTYSWMAILGKNGFVQRFLNLIGITGVNLLYTDFAVMLGMIYNFLPFMVLPIYTSLINTDNDLVNAAYDLGANKMQVFCKVVFPLSLPGVMSGITMVFMPAVSTFVISRLLGGGQYMLLGNLIEQQFTTAGNWNFGSAISIFMMILILISMAIMSKLDNNNEEGGKN